MEKVAGFTITIDENKISVVQGNDILEYEVLQNNFVQSIRGMVDGTELEHLALKEGVGIAQYFKTVAGSGAMPTETMDFVYNAHTALFKAGYLTYQIK